MAEGPTGRDLRRLVVHRALSAGIEGPTKGWQARFVPLSDAAADALARLDERRKFTDATDYVFCNRIGRPLDGAVGFGCSSVRRLAQMGAKVVIGAPDRRGRRVAARVVRPKPAGA